MRLLPPALLVLALAGLSAQVPPDLDYPRLGSLGPDDYIYRQHQEELAAAYAAGAAGPGGTASGSGANPPGRPAALVLYLYVPRGELDLFSLAARLNLPYESLATLNGLDRSRSLSPGERVLVPSAPGLFIADNPRTDLDFLLSYRARTGGVPLELPGRSGTRRLLFLPGARFNPEERALFLGLLFRFPLPSGSLTSGFGGRTSPITGKYGLHPGIDLAAPAGTEVFAAREGRVAESGVDPGLGQYLVVEHEGGWSTVYGHLSERSARLNDRVESGMIIGRVGSTGLSTGPHLHFEVRVRGEARDPAPLIPKAQR